MRKSIPTILLAALILQGCSYLGVKDEAGQPKAPTETAVEAPFSSEIPEKFSADLELSAFSNDKNVVRKYFVAHSGKQTLEKYNVGGAGEFWLLIDKEKNTYRLDPRKKTYKKIETARFSGRSDPLSKSLTAKLIYRRSFKTFEKLDLSEGLQKYKVKEENSKETATYLYVDKELNIPVKQESYSIKQGKEELVFKTEFKNISTEPPATLFALPEDFSEAS